MTTDSELAVLPVAVLPAPDSAAEDAAVQQWAASDDVDGLGALITAAVEARRPQLAARLVGLLDGRVQITAGTALARAQAAARMLLVAPAAAAPALGDDLVDAWLLARRSHIQHVTARIRSRNQGGSGVFLDPPSASRRKPRLTGRTWRS